VKVSLRAHPPGSLPQGWTCDDHDPDIALQPSDRLLASATEEVAIDRGGTGCDSGSLQAQLTLVPVK
jgi:hypothetical protein